MWKLSEELLTSAHTYCSPPPGVRYAAERGPGLIHLHRVHESREGEDAHGDEEEQAAHLQPRETSVCHQQALMSSHDKF